MTWESLTAYSFVYPAGESGQRLHQLMAAALREHLSEPVTRETHLLLRRLWDRRAAGDANVTNVGALREAVYHGVRASVMSPEEILDYADRTLRRGGRQATDGMVTDLGEFLQTGSDPDLAETAQCLAAEAAVIMGDTTRAGALTAGGPPPRLERAAGARLAIAAAHARRIAGDTVQAGDLYAAVWRHHPGPARHAAGLWIADIHMWQGRFATAFAFAREVLDSSDLDVEQRGDIIRLLHLGHRFHLNLDSAAMALREARDSYQCAGSVVGLANIATNQVELLAWTDPAAAVRAAPAALEAQQELGALHELGKTHTALAIAQTRLGEARAAADSFALGCDYLKRARYRSGLARAEFFRGFLHARQGNLGHATASINWAVSELVAAEVYPNLIITAELALDHLGITDPEVTSAAATARAQFEPLDSITGFEARTVALIAAMLGEGP